MEFEYDENKSQSNLEKHGIDFIDASKIWDGDATEIRRELRKGEERISVVGEFRGRAFTVVYTQRGENVRIISAHPANRTERTNRDKTFG